MALSITQTPATASLSQSPIIFTVVESNTATLTSSSFQYVGELYYWNGAITASGSIPNYTISKFPNNSNVGIFDLNRIINSTLTDLRQQNASNIEYFAVDFYTQYLSSSVFVTGSHVKTSTYRALDGYGLFPETIGQQLETLTTEFPLLTDGPTTQSFFEDNKGTIGFWNDLAGSGSTTLTFTSSDSQTQTITVPAASSTSTSIVYQVPAFPAEAGFPLTGSLYDWYKITAVRNGNTGSIRFNKACLQKYPNVRMKWKNRFGQFDWFNFYMVNTQSFETEKRTYQPQLGSWEGSTFGYNSYDSANLNYISDSKQRLQVNTDWVSESYNDIFKQLLVSDEIYWIYNESLGLIRPMTIATSNVVFKTGVVDKVIQYTFDFDFGQQYKLIM